MHVLVTADTVGGVWTYAREVVTGLCRRGVTVTLVSFGEIPNSEQSEWMEGLKTLDYHPTAFRLEWMQEAEEDLRASSEYLESIVRDVKPDLLHLSQYSYGGLAVDVPRIVVAHSDVVSWWVAVHNEEPKDSKWMRWYREQVSRGLARANAVVAPSQWMLSGVQTYFVRPACGSVIYNGRSPQLFNPDVSKDDSALTVGRLWDGGKQVSLLLQDDLPMTTLVVGSERDPETGSSTFHPGSGRVRVHFKGPQGPAQLAELYSRASIYVGTSRYEPFGLAPVEAALSRCALVLNDIPTFREIWGDAAVYFRYNDRKSLMYELGRLQQDRDLRETYGGLAYQRARQRFNAERMVDDYLNLYQTLVPAGVCVA